jgi:hypothetical protein
LLICCVDSYIHTQTYLHTQEDAFLEEKNTIIALYTTVEATNIQTMCPKSIHKVQYSEKAKLNPSVNAHS